MGGAAEASRRLEQWAAKLPSPLQEEELFELLAEVCRPLSPLLSRLRISRSLCLSPPLSLSSQSSAQSPSHQSITVSLAASQSLLSVLCSVAFSPVDHCVSHRLSVSPLSPLLSRLLTSRSLCLSPPLSLSSQSSAQSPSHQSITVSLPPPLSLFSQSSAWCRTTLTPSSSGFGLAGGGHAGRQLPARRDGGAAAPRGAAGQLDVLAGA
jgi:hypothetical protein